MNSIKQYIRDFKHPELLFRPMQLFYYSSRVKKPNLNEFEEIILPWKLKIKVRPDDYIGKTIWTMGLYDLCICESIWRLLDIGESAIDVGANIGQMTSLMAAKVGKQGKILAFEPHPELYKELLENVHNWAKKTEVALIDAQQIALSDNSSQRTLHIPNNFNHNRGRASLNPNYQHADVDEKSYQIQLRSLDTLLEKNENVGLIKLDVEGHELQVLKGCQELIKSDRIRDIIFEEQAECPYPTEITTFLESHGYSLFFFYKTTWSIEITTLKEARNKHKVKGYYNCLATKNPDRVLARFKYKGWTVLNFAPFEKNN